MFSPIGISVAIAGGAGSGLLGIGTGIDVGNRLADWADNSAEIQHLESLLAKWEKLKQLGVNDESIKKVVSEIRACCKEMSTKNLKEVEDYLLANKKKDCYDLVTESKRPRIDSTMLKELLQEWQNLEKQNASNVQSKKGRKKSKETDSKAEVMQKQKLRESAIKVCCRRLKLDGMREIMDYLISNNMQDCIRLIWPFLQGKYQYVSVNNGQESFKDKKIEYSLVLNSNNNYGENMTLLQHEYLDRVHDLFCKGGQPNASFYELYANTNRGIKARFPNSYCEDAFKSLEKAIAEKPPTSRESSEGYILRANALHASLPKNQRLEFEARRAEIAKKVGEPLVSKMDYRNWLKDGVSMEQLAQFQRYAATITIDRLRDLGYLPEYRNYPRGTYVPPALEQNARSRFYENLLIVTRIKKETTRMAGTRGNAKGANTQAQLDDYKKTARKMADGMSLETLEKLGYRPLDNGAYVNWKDSKGRVDARWLKVARDNYYNALVRNREKLQTMGTSNTQETPEQEAKRTVLGEIEQRKEYIQNYYRAIQGQQIGVKSMRGGRLSSPKQTVKTGRDLKIGISQTGKLPGQISLYDSQQTELVQQGGSNRGQDVSDSGRPQTEIKKDNPEQIGNIYPDPRKLTGMQRRVIKNSLQRMAKTRTEGDLQEIKVKLERALERKNYSVDRVI